MDSTDLNDFKDKLAEALREHPLQEDESSGYENLAGFHFCRRVQGALLTCDKDPARINPLGLLPIIRDVLEYGDFCIEFDVDTVLEVVVDTWDKIRCPSGVDTVDYAASRARASTDSAPGKYVTESQAEVASLIWRTMCALPRIDGTVYLSIRDAGEAAQVDKDTAHRAIRMLVRNRIIEEAQKGGKGRATRYRILIDTDGDRGL